MAPPPIALSLFWRTFVLLALLLAGGVAAWVQALRALEFEPRAIEAAQHTAGLVNLARASLQSTDGINRVALLKGLGAQNSSVRVTLRESGDRVEPFAVDRFTRLVSGELTTALGPDATVGRSVNGRDGMWVGFSIDRDRYWLHSQVKPTNMLAGSTWAVWTGIALLATLVGSAMMAGLINRPLKELSSAAGRIRDGKLDSQLDENTMTSEIREVNRGFNRMARELARVDEDRAVMLAGISHDLRTPLARLRLETEMSVDDEEAKQNMALDIAQLDAIIDKFMDYARPGTTVVRPLCVSAVADRQAAAFRDPGQVRIHNRLPDDLEAMADDTELGRVLLNLFENARRYGRTPATGVADVTVSAQRVGGAVIVSVRDHGEGVPAEKLPHLTTPFFRGDAARTAATGAGLGLAIVDKAMQRMGGTLELANAGDGGLVAHLRLRRPGSDG